MGFWKDMFAGNAPENEAEKQANIDYNIEKAARGGEDPIPDKAPDWARDISEPKDYSGKDSK
jgi:hypothetical protein